MYMILNIHVNSKNIMWRTMNNWDNENKEANSCVKELLCLDEFIQYSHLCLKAKGPISLAETSPRLPWLPWLISCGNSGDSGDLKMACAVALSPRRRRRDCRDWSVTATRETKTWLVLSRRGDVSETCWRLKKSQKKIEHVWISRDSPETRLVSRRRRGDVSATSGDSSRHLVSRPVR